jgi:hypothetical protein
MFKSEHDVPVRLLNRLFNREVNHYRVATFTGKPANLEKAGKQKMIREKEKSQEMKNQGKVSEFVFFRENCRYSKVLYTRSYDLFNH